MNLPTLYKPKWFWTSHVQELWESWTPKWVTNLSKLPLSAWCCSAEEEKSLRKHSKKDHDTPWNEIWESLLRMEAVTSTPSSARHELCDHKQVTVSLQVSFLMYKVKIRIISTFWGFREDKWNNVCSMPGAEYANSSFHYKRKILILLLYKNR